MIKIIIQSMVVFFILWHSMSTAAASVKNSCNSEAATFIATPNQKTIKLVSGDNDIKCWNIIKLNANLNKVLHTLKKGNEWSAQYIIKHIKYLDGGNLEDSIIALGEFSTIYSDGMEKLMLSVKDSLLPKNLFKDALTMLPLSLSDDPCKQLSALKFREDRVLRVIKNNLADEKIFALKAIDDFMLEIKTNTPNLPCVN